jgi:hypothetical protein
VGGLIGGEFGGYPDPDRVGASDQLCDVLVDRHQVLALDDEFRRWISPIECSNSPAPADFCQQGCYYGMFLDLKSREGQLPLATTLYVGITCQISSSQANKTATSGV